MMKGADRLIQSVIDNKANDLKMVKRTPEEMKQMQPGYYMDLNANLAIVTKITPVEKEGREGFEMDADVVGSGVFLFDFANINALNYWEYLGEL